MFEEAAVTASELVVLRYCDSSRVGTCMYSSDPNCSPYSEADSVMVRFTR